MADSITLEEAKQRLITAEQEYREAKALWDAAKLSRGGLTPQQYKMRALTTLQSAQGALDAHEAQRPLYRPIPINDVQQSTKR